MQTRHKATAFFSVRRLFENGAKWIRDGRKILGEMVPRPLRPHEETDDDSAFHMTREGALAIPAISDHRPLPPVARAPLNSAILPPSRRSDSTTRQLVVRSVAGPDPVAVQAKKALAAIEESASDLLWAIDAVRAGRADIQTVLEDFNLLLEDIARYDQRPERLNVAWELAHAYGRQRIQAFLPGTAEIVLALLLEDIAKNGDASERFGQFFGAIDTYARADGPAELKAWAREFRDSAHMLIQRQQASILDFVD